MQAEVKKAYVDTPAGQVHYRYRAGSGVPVVFLHQTASSSAMFEAMMAAYPGEERLVALDTPGFGGSFDPPGQPVIRDYAGWLADAAAALGLDRYHLFGHHTGACVGVEMAAAWPERVASLAIIGPVVLSAEERDTFRELYPKAFRPSPDGAHLQKMWAYVREIGGDDLSLELWQREFTDTSRAWQGHIQVYSTIWDQDFGALLERVSAPLLMMCSPGDVLWPVFDRARHLRPDAEFMELGGTNFQPDQEPARIAEVLAAFLRGLPGAG